MLAATMSTMKPVFPAVWNTLAAAPSAKYLRTWRPHSYFTPATRRLLFQTSRPSALPAAPRSFSTSSSKAFADVNDSFHLRQQDRETDDVDVCIVGGGIFLSHRPLNP